tara:strand:+ start:974 stop:1540 length:567 start_codon:yes stop_codon:yes gene_type:complete
MHSLYRFYSDDDTLLYVGQSRNPFQRLNGHFCDKQMDMVRYIELEWFDTPDAALRAEAWAIRREKPLWNAMAPVKPRNARVTPRAAVKRPAPVRQEPVRPAPKYYASMGPHLPPMFGPPTPCKQYAVDIDTDTIDGIDFSFSGGRDAMKRAFKVARYGDVIHLKRGSLPIHHVNHAGVISEVPYVQFH